MIPHQVTLQHPKVEVFSRLILKEIKVNGYNLIALKCWNTCDEVMNFTLVGKEQTERFLTMFRSDSVT